MEYKGFDISVREAHTFAVRDGESDYVVTTDKMVYEASCSAGVGYATTPESAVTLVKKLIDSLK